MGARLTLARSGHFYWYTIESMTTAEKEKRVMDLGGQWAEIMAHLQSQRSLTADEESSPHSVGIKLGKEHMYSYMLSLMLDAAPKSE